MYNFVKKQNALHSLIASVRGIFSQHFSKKIIKELLFFLIIIIIEQE